MVIDLLKVSHNDPVNVLHLGKSSNAVEKVIPDNCYCFRTCTLLSKSMDMLSDDRFVAHQNIKKRVA